MSRQKEHPIRENKKNALSGGQSNRAWKRDDRLRTGRSIATLSDLLGSGCYCALSSAVSSSVSATVRSLGTEETR